MAKLSSSSVFKAAAWAAGLATVGNLALYFISFFAGIWDPSATAKGQSIGLINVVMASIVPMFVGALILLGLNAISGNPLKIFNIIVVVFTLLSMGGPFQGIQGAPMGMKLCLALMHIIAGAAAWYAFNRKTSAKA
jgi:Family of unknown function (DUF6069)